MVGNVATNQAAIAGKMWTKQCCDGQKSVTIDIALKMNEKGRVFQKSFGGCYVPVSENTRNSKIHDIVMQSHLKHS